MAASERVRLHGLKPVLGDLVYEKTNEKKRAVLHLDENNINDYTFDDIVLPLPGFTITYPKNREKLYFFAQSYCKRY